MRLDGKSDSGITFDRVCVVPVQLPKQGYGWMASPSTCRLRRPAGRVSRPRREPATHEFHRAVLHEVELARSIKYFDELTSREKVLEG
jgi:hypothetical protein